MKNGFVRLADSDWVNIVNHPDVLDRSDGDAELAVACAVRLTEGRLRELNTRGAAIGPQCRDCADFAPDGICPNSGKPCAPRGVPGTDGGQTV